MTKRETRLAVILVVVLFAIGIGMVTKLAYLNPLKDVEGDITMYADTISKRQNEIKNKRAEIEKMKKLNPRLKEWKRLSLPDIPLGTARTEQAYTRHMSKLRIEYKRYLDRLLEKNRFRATNVARVKGNANEEISRGKILYRKLGFSVSGQGSLKSFTSILEDLHRTPLLHQVKNFTISKPETRSGESQQSTDLDIRFTVEALLVSGAERRLLLLPTFKEEETYPVVLASENRVYDDLLGNNVFYPIKEEKPPVETKQTQDKREVLKYVKLTGIFRKGTRRRKATLVNAWGKDDVTTLAVSPAWEAFLIRDFYGEEVIKGRVVYLDSHMAVMEIDKKYYRMNLGDSLYYILDKGLMTKDEVKKLGVEIEDENLKTSTKQ